MGVRFTDDSNQDPPISPLTPSPSFGLMTRPSFTPSLMDDEPPSKAPTPRPLPSQLRLSTSQHQIGRRPSAADISNGQSPHESAHAGKSPQESNNRKNKNPFGNYRDNYTNNYSNLNAGKDVSDDERESNSPKAVVSHHIFPTRNADPVNDGGFPEAVNPDTSNRESEGLIPVNPVEPAMPIMPPANTPFSPAPSYVTNGPNGPPTFRSDTFKSDGLRPDNYGSDTLRVDSFRGEASRSNSFVSDNLRVDSYNRPGNSRANSFRSDSGRTDTFSTNPVRVENDDGKVTPLHLLGSQPDIVDCPFCRRRVETRVEKKASTMTHVTATTLFLTTIAGGIAPYAAKWQSNMHHYCTSCGRKVALKRHGRKMAEPLGTPDHLRESSKFG